MKTLEKPKSKKQVGITFVKDESLVRFEGVDLFPEKTARAKERMKNVKLPQ